MPTYVYAKSWEVKYFQHRTLFGKMGKGDIFFINIMLVWPKSKNNTVTHIYPTYKDNNSWITSYTSSVHHIFLFI